MRWKARAAICGLAAAIGQSQAKLLLTVLAVSFGLAATLPVRAAEPGQAVAPLILSPETPWLRATPHLEVFKDETGRHTIETIQDELGFEAAGERTPTFGYTDAVIWLRIFARRTEGATGPWMLSVANAVLDDITLFVPLPDGGFAALRAGDRVDIQDTAFPHRHYVFPIDPPVGTAATYFIRVASASSIAIPIEFATAEEFAARDHTEQSMLGAYFGLLAAVALYLLALLLVMRNTTYAWLSFFIVALGLFQGELTGFAGDLLWADNRWFGNYVVVFSGVFAIFSAMGYGARSFHAASNARWFYLLSYVVRAAALSSPALMLIDYRASLILNTFLALIAIPAVAGLSFQMVWQRQPGSVLYFAGWAGLWIGVFILMLKSFGIIPVTPLTNNIHLFGSAIGFVVLAAAVAQQFRIERDRQEAALRKNETRLEHLVRARTIDLSDRNDELAKSVRDLAKAKQTAEAANRSKDQFLAHMSHELRTPLNAIIGFSEAIKERILGSGNSEKNVEYARDIHDSGNHLLSLIDDLLDHAKIEAGQYELSVKTFELQPVIAESIKLLDGRARENDVRLDDRTGDVLPSLNGDRRAIKQVLLNLLSNAVKFTPPGGHVTISGERKSDGGLTISITDTGIGISEEALESIFEPFQRGDDEIAREHEGTGLGLAIARQFVEMHGGRMRIMSEVGAGTTLSVSLPAACVRGAGASGLQQEAS